MRSRSNGTSVHGTLCQPPPSDYIPASNPGTREGIEFYPSVELGSGSSRLDGYSVGMMTSESFKILGLITGPCRCV